VSLENGIDFIALVPFAAFGLFAVIAWWLLGLVSARKPRHEQRLDEFKDPSIHGPSETATPFEETGTVGKMLRQATPALAKPLQPKKEAEVGKLKLRLTKAGFRDEAAPTMFLGIKFMCLLIGLAAGGGIVLLVTGLNQSGLVKAITVAGITFFIPDLVVWHIGRKRTQQIFLGLPDALDLMVVCVEAGLGLDQALRKVTEEMKKSYHAIAEEFGLCNLQLQMGRTRPEALHELGQRTGVSDLRSLASIIVQADKFGSSIAQALRVQSDAMRTRRRQMAEEKAAKTAVKLIFPLVVFIFPGIFVVLVGPAAIAMMRQMLPAMSGGG